MTAGRTFRTTLALAAIGALSLTRGSARADGTPPAPPAPAPAPAPAPGANPTANPGTTGAAWVSGTVVDEDDKPIAGADVKVVREKPPGIWLGTSDAKGFFMVRGVPAGPATAIVSAKGRVPVRQEVKVPATGVASVSAKLTRGVRFAGKLVDGDGKPVAGARLQAFESSGDSRGWDWISFSSQGGSTSAADGSFEVDGLSPAATYRLHIEHPHYLALDMPGLDASAGGGHDSLNVTLEPAAWVTGVVVDTQGRPVAGARVQGPDPDAGSMPDWFGRIRVLLRSGDGSAADAQGRFLVGGLSPGDVRLSASADSCFDGSVALSGLTAGQERSGVKIVIETATAWIEGVVVDDLDKPVAGADLHALGEDGPAAAATSDAQGRFRLQRVRSRAAVAVDASREGHWPVSKADVPLNSSGLKLTLTRVAHLKVKVLGPDGKPPEQVGVKTSRVLEGGKIDEDVNWYAGTEAGLDVAMPIGEVTVRIVAKGLHETVVGTWTTEPAKVIDGGVVNLEKAKPSDAPDDG